MKKVIITGVCGFTGTCLAMRLKKKGIKVIGIDNLSRRGTTLNAHELAGDLFILHKIDVSNAASTFKTFSKIGSADAVFHLAGQVAVTKSYEDRINDFMNNAVGSFNVIEAVKRYTPMAYCLYASTNKVYGHIKVSKPVGLKQPLNPYTPYGVSKAAGELYFSEYGKKEIGITSCCLRQSCIYGHHQYGVEDQGWIAWFVIANILNLPLTIYGDGMQRRDLLFIDDLVDLYLECSKKRLSGVYPIGGGISNSITLNESTDLIAKITGKRFLGIKYDNVRPGDQPYFVADLSWTKELGLQWSPKISLAHGIERMARWIYDNKDNIKKVLEL